MPRKTPSQTTPILLLLAACAGGGTQNEIVAYKPDIAVAPSTVDFGEVVVDYTDSQLLRVVNAGKADLTISDMTISDNEDGVFTITETALVIPKEETVAVELRFAPATFIEYARTLTITSDDPDSPSFDVPLVGLGGDGPIPDIALDPAIIDFGSPAGASTQWFTIQNTGDGDLVIEGVSQSGSGQFSSPNLPAAGTVIAPGSQTTIIVVYEPVGIGQSGALLIETNDPDEPELTVTLLGDGGGSDVYPQAVIDCPTLVDPPTSLPLDGRDSYDPGGHAIVSYEWSVVEAPDGADGAIVDPTADLTALAVDMAGDWEVDLTVTNDLGVRSAPARCEFEAVPQAAVHVELIWDKDDADLDLHLVKGGAEIFDSPDDCCFCNRSPDWGVMGGADDPRFAIDNEYGFGPEEVKIDLPADDDYAVRVHYYADKGGASTTATVRVWVEGEIAHEESMLLTHNDLWNVGYIRWPMAVFVEEDVDVDASTARTCY